MTFIRIHCRRCGRIWRVSKIKAREEEARTCRTCGASIDSQTWMNQIIPAMEMCSDANRELFKDHTGYGTPFFQVDVITKAYKVEK